MESQFKLFCPECKKETHHRIFPNDMTSFGGRRVWELCCCSCGVKYSCQTEWGGLTEEVVQKLLDTREQCKMFWTDEEREAEKSFERSQSECK